MFRGYIWGVGSQGHIDTTEPIMQMLCNKTLEIANKRKLHCPDISITCGKREADEQFKLFKIGRIILDDCWLLSGEDKPVTNCDGYEKLSSHQSGLAIDFCAWIDGKPNYDIANLALIATCFFEAASDLGINIDWGGSFKSISDAPHIEIIL